MNNQQKKEIIKNQILLNPTLDDNDLYLKLTTKDIPVKVNIPTKDLEIYLLSKGLMWDFMANQTPSVSVARRSLELFSPEIDIEKNYTLFLFLLQSLVDESTFNFNESNKEEVLSMLNKLNSWAEQNISDLTVGDIQEARL